MVVLMLFALVAGAATAVSPCVLPVLPVAQSFGTGRLAVALAYGAGSAAVLYLLMLGGRRLTSRLTRHSGRLQMAMGGVMVVIATLMLFMVDTRFETAIAGDLPSFLVDPSKSLEQSHAAQARLAALHRSHATSKEAGIAEARRAAPLPVLGTAPDFTGNQDWFNTPGDRPLTLAGLH